MLSQLFDDIRRVMWCFEQGLSLFHPARADITSVSLRSKQLAYLLGQQSADLSQNYLDFLVSGMVVCLEESLDTDVDPEVLNELVSDFRDQFSFWQGVTKNLLPATKEWPLPKRSAGRPAIPEQVINDLERSRKIAQEKAKKRRFLKAEAKKKEAALARVEKLRQKAAELEAANGITPAPTAPNVEDNKNLLDQS